MNIDADCVAPPYYLKNLRSGINDLGERNILFAGLRRFVRREALAEASILKREIDFRSLQEVPSPANYFVLGDRRLPSIRWLHRTDHPWAFFHGCNTAYQRDVARKINGFDELFDGCWGYEDTDFTYRMIVDAGAAPAFIENIEVYHVDSADSGCQNRFNKLTNRNWHLIASRIPGLADFKRQRYQTIGGIIV